MKAKKVTTRFKKVEAMPHIEERKKWLGRLVADKLLSHAQELAVGHKRLRPALKLPRTQMVKRHRTERAELGSGLIANR
ncbi:hypothetical protein [Palleronia aestuarii]|uniref:hypothetical protein n=1 Tax=Palleronia aestuarii TaxID=568105 RepID=UPI0011B3E58D|nr:hypothetical protein [Palleronia aestuarii]